MDKNDDFEALYYEDASISHRGKEKVYRFAELSEEDSEKVFDSNLSNAEQSTQLVLAAVTDADGTKITLERLKKMPGNLVNKLKLKALEVNGYGPNVEAEDVKS